MKKNDLNKSNGSVSDTYAFLIGIDYYFPNTIPNARILFDQNP